MIVSFARTTESLLAGIKTVTRREWKDSHAKKFHKGMLIDAWNYSPRMVKLNPKKVAIIRLICDPYKERLCDMPESDVKLEGDLWLDKWSFIANNFEGKEDKEVWVVRFELVPLEVIKDG